MGGSYPHQITKPAKVERRRSRNCLRIDYLSDGAPEPRCNLRPLDGQAQWILDNRPFHLAEHADLFDYCIRAASCEACPVRRQAVEATRFHSVTVHVRQVGYRHVVTCLGQCTWYDLYVGTSLQAARSWVESHGGALGAASEDERGAYREGFVNYWQIREELRPDRSAAQLARGDK